VIQTGRDEREATGLLPTGRGLDEGFASIDTAGMCGIVSEPETDPK